MVKVLQSDDYNQVGNVLLIGKSMHSHIKRNGAICQTTSYNIQQDSMTYNKTIYIVREMTILEHSIFLVLGLGAL